MNPSGLPHPADAPPPDRDEVVEIRTTFPGQDEARACAERLVHERFAACVQVDGPITSVYRWGGTMETATEYRCTCKTSRRRVSACTAAVLASHPYRTPELIVIETRATTAYAAWVKSVVEGEPRSGDGGDADAKP